jgi:hypothetical protein
MANWSASGVLSSGSASSADETHRLASIDLTDLDYFTNGSPRELFSIHRRVMPGTPASDT